MQNNNIGGISLQWFLHFLPSGSWIPICVEWISTRTPSDTSIVLQGMEQSASPVLHLLHRNKKTLHLVSSLMFFSLISLAAWKFCLRLPCHLALSLRKDLWKSQLGLLSIYSSGHLGKSKHLCSNQLFRNQCMECIERDIQTWKCRWKIWLLILLSGLSMLRDSYSPVNLPKNQTPQIPLFA